MTSIRDHYAAGERNFCGADLHGADLSYVTEEAEGLEK